MIYNSTDHQGERWSWKLQGGKEIAVPHYSSVAISCFSNILSFLDLADAVRERVSEWPILCAATQSNVRVSSLGWSLWRNRPSAAPLQDINHVEMCVWMCLERSRLPGWGKKTNSLSITPLTWTGNVLLSCCRADCQSTFHASPTRPVTAKFFLTKHSVCYRHKYNPLSFDFQTAWTRHLTWMFYFEQIHSQKQMGTIAETTGFEAQFHHLFLIFWRRRSYC